MLKIASRSSTYCRDHRWKMLAQSTQLYHEGHMSSQSLVPRDGFDTHVHVFDPKLGPYAADRAYTPEDAPLENFIAFNDLVSENYSSNTFVLVQPSPYKCDCSVMIQCLQRLRAQNIRAFGIAVLDLDSVSDAKLKEMHDLGIRGLRLNFQADGKEVSTDRLRAALTRAADRIRDLPDWMIQLFIPGWAWDSLYETILQLPVRIIADHLGGMRGHSLLPSDLQSIPTSQPGFVSLMSLARQSRVVIKMSGLYRMSSDTCSTYSDLKPIVETLAQEAPKQVIWGSDWPHTGDGHNRLEGRLDVKEPFRVIKNDAILNHLHDWMGSDAYKKMMVDNPKRIYHQ